MVKVTDYRVFKNHETQEEFYALVLTGGLEVIKSKNTGKQYATIKKCSMPASFDEETCKALIGQEMQGRIDKVPCDEYEITDKKTGELITVNFTYQYVDEANTVEEAIFEPVALV